MFMILKKCTKVSIQLISLASRGAICVETGQIIKLVSIQLISLASRGLLLFLPRFLIIEVSIQLISLASRGNIRRSNCIIFNH